MKDQYVIYFGPTQMIEWAGAFHQEEQDIHSDKTLASNSINKIISN